MGLGNTILWGDLLPGGPTGGLPNNGIDIDQVIDDLLPTLHAANRQELYFWTDTDLIEWLDEAVKRLARTACVFVGRSASTLSDPGVATYPLPTDHISTLRVAYETQALHPTIGLALEARDPAFESVPGDPDSWYASGLGLAAIGICPVPYRIRHVAIIYEGFPTALDKMQTLVPAPAPLKGYLAMCVVAEAYGRESEVETPDLAEHARQRVAMYEQALIQYFGAGK